MAAWSSLRMHSPWAMLLVILIAGARTSWGQGEQPMPPAFAYLSDGEFDPSRVPADVASGRDGSRVPQAATAAGSAPAGGGPGASRTSCCWGHPVEWSKVPAWLCPLPRPAFFPNPPNEPGYFTVVDWLHGDCQEKRPLSGYPPFAMMPHSFFDADFRYVESKPVVERTAVEKLKRIQLSDCLMFSTGGQAWVRFHKENNSRLTEVEQSFALPRVRTYGDLWFADVARVYGEYIWADSVNAGLPPLLIDENRGDILNLFLDVNVLDWDGAPVVARVGRQELLLGSQRLVSTIDWANTRRTFEGVRVFRRGEKWDVDAFWTQFVPPAADEFDRPDEDQDFAGAWATYRREKGEFLDFYYLFLHNTNDIHRQGLVEAPVEAHTIGSRWTGDQDSYLWDFEGAIQFGDRGGRDLVAGTAAAGVGRHLQKLPGNPTGWLYYEYASGDANPDNGTSNTFNHLYSFGHYYLGWADLVGRQNIHDVNAQLYFYPTQWMTVWLQYHHFWLAAARDALYNPAGVAVRRDPTGESGRNVGDEVDIILNFHLTDTSDILLAYCRLWGGGFLEGTAGPNRAADAEMMYFMYQVKW